MINLLIYINPRQDFGDEEKIMVKIQIDNSLDLGWKKEDIILATNFPYEYNSIKAIEVSGENYAPFFPQASKINTIVDLFEKGFIKKGELTWFHDLDAFQNEVITEDELELDSVDMGLCDKGRMPRWDTGSVFFKESSKDIFGWVKEITNKFQINEEYALMSLTTNNILWAAESSHEETIGERVVPVNIPGTENIGQRVKKINISYNFVGWNLRSVYPMAIKPIRVVHFHPAYPNPYPGSPSVLDFFLHGKNKIGVQLVPERLLKIFNRYGIR